MSKMCPLCHTYFSEGGVMCPSCMKEVSKSMVREHQDGGVKHDQGKIRYDLIPPESLDELAMVYTVGAIKYGDRNWERGMGWGRIFAAIMRHLWAWWRREDQDQEDGISHLAHAAWGCLTLMSYARHGIGEDTRSGLNKQGE